MTTNASDRATHGALALDEIAACYFALQAAVGVLLWLGADQSATVRSWLELVPDHPEVTNAFRAADVVVIAASALAAWALWRRQAWAMAPVWFTVGGIVYPTVCLISWVATTDETGGVALGMMLLASALCCGAAIGAWRARHRI